MTIIRASRATRKRDRAEAKLIKVQREMLEDKRDAYRPSLAERLEKSTAQWDEILAAFKAGEIIWDDLGRIQKLQMPISYQLKCKAAQRRLAPTEPVVEVVPEPVVNPVVLVAEPVASAAELVAPAELKASDLSFGQKVTADRVIIQARKAGVKLSKPEAYAYVLAGHMTYADAIATTN